MTQQTNWKLAVFLAVFISGPVLAEDAATGAIKPLSSGASHCGSRLLF
jgi:hypothetical protein